MAEDAITEVRTILGQHVAPRHVLVPAHALEDVGQDETVSPAVVVGDDRRPIRQHVAHVRVSEPIKLTPVGRYVCHAVPIQIFGVHCGSLRLD